MMRALLVGLILAMVWGCMPGAAAKARPLAPSQLSTEIWFMDPETGEKTFITLQGISAENPEDAMTIAATKEGVLFNGGTSMEMDWGAISSSPVALFGCGLFVLGIALLALSKFPIAGLIVPSGMGWVFLGGGLLLIWSPFIGEALQPVITIVGIIGGLGVLAYYAHKAKWFDKATGSDAVLERLDKGDPEGAATLLYLNRKGDQLGKMKARAVRRNGGAMVAAAAEADAPPPPAAPAPPAA